MASHKDEAEQHSPFLRPPASGPRYSIEDETWLQDEIEMSGNVSDPPSPGSTDNDGERELVSRLDKRLLAFAMMGNLVKTLDNNNLSKPPPVIVASIHYSQKTEWSLCRSVGNAFISGMEEELDIQGTQYNWMTVLFIIGYLS